MYLVRCIEICSLRFSKVVLKYIFLANCVVFTGCTHGIKYGVKQLYPCADTIEDALGAYNFDVDLSRQIRRAEDRGFLVQGRNRRVMNRDIASAMELGLSDIYFNTIRWRLSTEKNKQTDPWDMNLIGDGSRFICPKPWEYRVVDRLYRGEVKKIGCFYLPGVQMGEYLTPKNNYNLICNHNDDGTMKNNAKAPYIMLSSNIAREYEDTKRASIVHLDHLIREDKYFIELPESLHVLKTNLLDPFYYQPNVPDRNFMNSGIYWRLNQEWLNINQIRNDNQRIESLLTCRCGTNFPQPEDGIVGEYHDHEDAYKRIYGATIFPMNLV